MGPGPEAIWVPGPLGPSALGPLGPQAPWAQALGPRSLSFSGPYQEVFLNTRTRKSCFFVRGVDDEKFKHLENNYFGDQWMVISRIDLEYKYANLGCADLWGRNTLILSFFFPNPFAINSPQKTAADAPSDGKLPLHSLTNL